MRISGANIGLLLAVIAGCFAIGQAIWQGSPPQAESLNFWLPLTIVVGAGFFLAAVLADSRTAIAKALLFGGGVLLIASGIYFGAVAGAARRARWRMLADVAPGVVAVVAGILIGPVRREALP